MVLCALVMLGTQERSHNRCVATLGFGKLGVSGVRCLVRPAIGSELAGVLCGLTFELSWHRRSGARARVAKMYRVPPDRGLASTEGLGLRGPLGAQRGEQ